VADGAAQSSLLRGLPFWPLVLLASSCWCCRETADTLPTKMMRLGGVAGLLDFAASSMRASSPASKVSSRWFGRLWSGGGRCNIGKAMFLEGRGVCIWVLRGLVCIFFCFQGLCVKGAVLSSKFNGNPFSFAKKKSDLL
jgi:hypothetical protein